MRRFQHFLVDQLTGFVELLFQSRNRHFDRRVAHVAVEEAGRTRTHARNGAERAQRKQPYQNFPVLAGRMNTNVHWKGVNAPRVRPCLGLLYAKTSVSTAGLQVVAQARERKR
eukprot:scpid76455/ scgid11702/ 